MYFLDYLMDSSRLEAKNYIYRIFMSGKYHNIGYFKYWLWGPFHNAYHTRPFAGIYNTASIVILKLTIAGKQVAVMGIYISISSKPGVHKLFFNTPLFMKNKVVAPLSHNFNRVKLHTYIIAHTTM